jgi:apolipoprotein N-acyltransferase
MLALSSPPADLGWLAWIAFWPLLGVLRGRPTAARAALGAVAGMVWALGTVMWWLEPAARAHLASGPVTATLLAAGAAWLYGGMYPCALAVVHPWLPAPRWLTVPAAWVMGETIRARAFSGAPWALLGHSQHAFLPLAQVAELTGVAGLSFLVLMPAAALAERGRTRVVGLCVAAALVLAGVVFGARRLATITADPDVPEGVLVRVVGGLAADADPLASYAAASIGEPPASLTIWPETAYLGYLQDDADARALVTRTAAQAGWLLFGTLRHEGRGTSRRYYNDAILIDPGGAVRGVYDKRFLVPFAERSPWPFPSLVARPFTPGTATPAPLTAGSLRVGPLVCWESIFPDPARRFARDGVDLLANLTSDRDLGAGAVQHVAFSRFAAIETRRWLVRASGGDDSLLIDPAGRLLRRSLLRVPHRAAAGETFIVRHDGWVTPAAVGLLALGAAASLRTRVRSRVRTR